MFLNLIRVVYVIISAFVWALFYYNIGYSVSYLLLGALIGIVVSGVLVFVETRLQKGPLKSIIAASIGLILGTIIANLLAYSISFLPFFERSQVFVICNLIMAYLFVAIFLKKKEELFQILSFSSTGKTDKSSGKPKLLDTSVIIDGRIADISETVFLEGPLSIPQFILNELQFIADSSDPLKRNRGRRGLDVLNKIQKQTKVSVRIQDTDFPEIKEVDSKLIRLAQVTNAKVITNDYNLNKIAELQEVEVLNINDLSNALKPVVLPGEEMTIQIIKEGKEFNQGVGYLDDGTMVVVEHGASKMGHKVDVVVTSVFQTSAGRMIFTKIR